MSLTTSITNDGAPMPTKVANQLKAQLGELLARYTVFDIMREISRQQPKFNFYVAPVNHKLSCPQCGTEVR